MADFPNDGPITPFGICVHTTGNGIPERALARQQTPLMTAKEVYGGMGKLGPHFCIEPILGLVDQYCDPGLERDHVGLSADARRRFLDGTWVDDRNRIDPAVSSWWQLRWPGVKSPSHLYPGQRPNAVYIGIELIPAGVFDQAKNAWVWHWGHKPGYDKQRFSVEQYKALAGLCRELAAKYSIDLSRPGRLVGHEDLNPYTRPGWDPGAFNKTFNWDMVRGLL